MTHVQEVQAKYGLVRLDGGLQLRPICLNSDSNDIQTVWLIDSYPDRRSFG